MARNEPLLVDDLQHGLQFQVATRRCPGSRILQLLTIFKGSLKGIDVDLFHTHSGIGIAPIVATSIGTFHVFTQGKLDEPRGALQFHVLRSRTPAQFDDGTLSPDRIAGAMQELRGSHPAGQLAVDVDILAVDDIPDAHFGGILLGTFIDSP